ncbi:MAG TPA: hypothetical protein VET65_01860 [Candidatus Limnocylindrales bacterium]|nr:hypothetical protein [Candidatus Limnocylindrales bacterium]
MDATASLAIICCAIVFSGWLVLPHAPARARATEVDRTPKRVEAAIPA